MTGEAVLGEDGPNILVEADLCFVSILATGRCGSDSQAETQDCGSSEVVHGNELRQGIVRWKTMTKV